MSELYLDGSEVENAINNVIESGFVDYVKVTEIMETNVKDHFSKGQGPDGTWKAKKDGNPSFLQKSGRLLGSIKKNPLKTKAQLYTEVEYGQIHNFGGLTGKSLKTKMPKREFFWLDEKTISLIIENIKLITTSAWRK